MTLKFLLKAQCNVHLQNVEKVCADKEKIEINKEIWDFIQTDRHIHIHRMILTVTCMYNLK